MNEKEATIMNRECELYHYHQNHLVEQANMVVETNKKEGEPKV